MSRARFYNLASRRDPRGLHLQVAETSARAFVPEALRSTPPAAKLDPARVPHLQLVTCASYGTLTITSCRARFGKANAKAPRAGQGAMDSSDLRLSACNGCAVGAERSNKRARVRKPVVDRTRVCKCGRTFEPDTTHRTRCEMCLDRQKAREGMGQPLSRSWSLR